ncbi:TetR/AcrR family transcriptional regulator [Paraburkholderia rhizosphaerae]|uniref:TetR family transcriptional regulator n=1 Tax=Paraburkholderia rhizosphaerae TaxID=480658 RepID=A0A4R8M1F6_9BURK|nr:TetR/AcrR family transcriptional regulator [Paraburkholderia rhizosphaerae]TDY53023.1 TetR family transcriptional regulator [Paraburkholderia rhizosphaerae]
MGIAERKNREKQALRERILDASRRIVVREGFAALSMRKIADAIEYSPATLYLHFENRDEIARALCTEGFAQLLDTLKPHLSIADPAERLKALWRAYVAFGVAHQQTYQLIFMEDPTYVGAAFASARDAGDDSGDAAFRLVADALDELKAQGRLPETADSEVWTEALWATMHGIVALRLTCPVFPRAPLDTVVDAALDAWLGAHTVRASDPPEPRKPSGKSSRAPHKRAAGVPASIAKPKTPHT